MTGESDPEESFRKGQHDENEAVPSCQQEGSVETHRHTKRTGFMVSYQMQGKSAARPDLGIPMARWNSRKPSGHQYGGCKFKYYLGLVEYWEGAFYLHGREPTHLTLQVTYPRPARVWQGVELVGWSFFLSNLKSVAMKGPDLRNRNQRLSWKKGYID